MKMKKKEIIENLQKELAIRDQKLIALHKQRNEFTQNNRELAQELRETQDKLHKALATLGLVFDNVTYEDFTRHF